MGSKHYGEKDRSKIIKRTNPNWFCGVIKIKQNKRMLTVSLITRNRLKERKLIATKEKQLVNS
jgi:hypothetical protein